MIGIDSYIKNKSREIIEKFIVFPQTLTSYHIRDLEIMIINSMNELYNEIIVNYSNPKTTPEERMEFVNNKKVMLPVDEEFFKSHINKMFESTEGNIE